MESRSQACRGCGEDGGKGCSALTEKGVVRPKRGLTGCLTSFSACEAPEGAGEPPTPPCLRRRPPSSHALTLCAEDELQLGKEVTTELQNSPAEPLLWATCSWTRPTATSATRDALLLLLAVASAPSRPGTTTLLSSVCRYRRAWMFDQGAAPSTPFSNSFLPFGLSWPCSAPLASASSSTPPAR